MSVSLVHPGDSRKQAEAVLNKPLETTQLKKNLVKPETVSSYIHHLKLYISPAKALQRDTHTHTLSVDFLITNMGILRSDIWLQWQGICGLWSSLASVCQCFEPMFVPDLQHYGRSVDSNKGLFNNRFHSATQEGPTWPWGVSCSFEHLKSLRSVWLSFVSHWWMFLCCFHSVCQHNGGAPV